MYEKIIEVRWADLDANCHVTHTAYASYATHARVSWMEDIGCSITKLLDLGYAGVLLKEQTEYFREVFLDEKVCVKVFFAGGSEDFSRWKFINEICKENGKLAAKHTVHGAWLNNQTRKIAVPPKDWVRILEKIEKDSDFEAMPNVRGGQ